jgi:hypothetical protein
VFCRQVFTSAGQDCGKKLGLGIDEDLYGFLNQLG